MAYNFANIVCAHGSWGVVQVSASYYLLDNVSAAYQVKVRGQDVTHSGSGGWVHHLTQLKSVESLAFEADFDSVADIEIGGLAICTNCIVWVKRGSVNKYDVFSDTKFDGVGDTRDNQSGAAIRRSYSFIGGSLATNTSPSVGLTAYLAGLSTPRPY